MLLRLPRGLHYPITITKVLKKADSIVARDEPVFLYTYETTVREGSRDGEDRFVKKSFPAKFESSLEGQLKFWKVWEGDVLERPVDVAEIEEECAHSEQFAGMCTNCGRDMTVVSSYNNDANDADRAPFQTSHDTQMLRISQREATRREEEAKRRLLASRKLSLVVDLDQTIIHAAVDPTIAEWQKDKDNPNHEAVKDVRAFQLIDDGPGMRGCWYYIKLRPGLEDFLKQISRSYELHIYTMGTRQYAEQIAKIVDPERKYFGDRILSRDESGSMTNKNLERLFPIDTKMVVIIDDRGDVWKWNANLVRVVPFDFFVGIGDINSSFLPKKPDIPVAPRAGKAEEAKKVAESGSNGHDVPKSDAVQEDVKEDSSNSSETSGTTDASALEQLVAMGGGDDPVTREIQSKGQEETIAAQVEEKPLLQMQKRLDAKDQAAAEDGTAANTTPSGDTQDSSPESESSSSSGDSAEPAPSPKLSPARHSLLRDDDRELVSLAERLSAVHATFFSEYDQQRVGQKGGRVAALSGKGGKIQLQTDLSTSSEDAADLLLVPDIKSIMPSMKRQVLSGTVIVFSGVLPLETDVQTAEISLWAKSFGATIADKVNKHVTHVVAARTGTSKVRLAFRKRVWVVGTKWLIDCMTRWNRVSEEDYVLEDPRGGKRGKQMEEGSQERSEEGDERKELLQDGRGFLLSSDEGEGETTGLDTEAETDENRKRRPGNSGAEAQPARKRLKLDTERIADDERMATDYEDDVNGFAEDASPLSINQDEWADMDKELREFMGSDIESDSDSESTTSRPTSRIAQRRKRQPPDGDHDLGKTKTDHLPQTPTSDLDSAGLKERNSPTTYSHHQIGDAHDRVDTNHGPNSLDGAVDTEPSIHRHEPVSETTIAAGQAQAEADSHNSDLSSDDELARELEREFDDDNDEAHTSTNATATGLGRD